ncbi:antibiotic biosynthesis monooxygenase [Clostridiaceae bacterium UIB06]|uniref:Antibiotic biosynthesis monooxygenase n=1 Tax=Clostridium thailandense TaxID=2794346 RepID=A0A949X285_9CLOT|nr:putative quinol monooxygenase [Clostridium thailandense]MBV7272929.1 antibiotic biosynthesis monooxygenase [Clostridium thailandense]MCH5136260.1 antibiotic biosynthesis monooxygenase [Clostridiaceae bacterium UIB06]
MIKVVAKSYVMEGKFEEYMNLCKKLVEKTREEEGCIKYEVYQDEKCSTVLTIIEEWESREALDKHMVSEHFKRIVPILGKFRAKQSDVNVYNKVI